MKKTNKKTLKKVKQIKKASYVRKINGTSVQKTQQSLAMERAKELKDGGLPWNKCLKQAWADIKGT